MANPLVSIVIDNFNYGRYLACSIESALSQTHPRTEVVVVDDASGDDSREVIRRYGHRVVPILLERNSGQGAALNAGFRASRGDLVLFLDADDYLYAEAVARVVGAWAPGISKVQFRLHLVDATGRTLDVYPPPEVRFDSGDVVPLLLATGRYETSVTSGNAFPREVLERILPVPEREFRISADGYLVTAAPFLGPVVSLEEPLGAYRFHGGNAWTYGPGLAARLRNSLQHDAHKFEVVRARARAAGLSVAAELGMGDHAHLTTRLASLCLEPARHPYPGDSRLRIALRGMASSGQARLPWKRRGLLAAWFAAVGLLPRPVASRAVTWRLVASARPPPFDRIFKAVRRFTR